MRRHEDAPRKNHGAKALRRDWFITRRITAHGAAFHFSMVVNRQMKRGQSGTGAQND
jgi:hypothetical protein